jgi:hypothetical protein
MQRAKPIQIISNPQNQHPDKWSSTVCMYGGCNNFCTSLRSNLGVLQTGLKNTRLWSVTQALATTCNCSTVVITHLLGTVTVKVQEQRLAINLNHTIKQTLNYQHLLLPLHKTLKMTVTCLHFSEDLWFSGHSSSGVNHHSTWPSENTSMKNYLVHFTHFTSSNSFTSPVVF